MKIRISHSSYLLLIPLFFLASCKGVPENRNENAELIWLASPATDWNEALPLGNGRLGVMVFGDTSRERIQLNDDSMWPGREDWKEPEGTPADLTSIRKLLIEGKNKEADNLFVEKFSNRSVIRSHQTLGDLYIDLDHDNISEYRRELDLTKAVSMVSYRTNGNLFREKVFVSHPDQAIIIELSSESKKGIQGNLSISRPDDRNQPTFRVENVGNDMLRMNGEVTQRNGVFRSAKMPINDGMKFETLVKVSYSGGGIAAANNSIQLKGCKKVRICVVSNSSWYYNDFRAQNAGELEAIDSQKSVKVFKNHVNDYRNFYDRLSLDIRGEDYSELPIDERLSRIKNGANDVGLETLLFNYGRYLLISSSRPGTNPANLQGLWNEHISAPWNCDYHLNINLQMNYWLADLTNLSELNDPLYCYIDRLVTNGKITAARNFGCRGTFIPHATDIWAPTWLRAETAYWGCSVGAGGWLMQHYWNGFEFSGDTLFLVNRVFPALENVAAFYSDWLIEDPRDGKLVSAPSTSPENQFIQPSGDTVATCLGSAMDQQIIAEVFDHYIEACSLLNLETDLLTKIKSQKKMLRPGFVLGKDGRILEWDREYKELEPGHRHMSHLYGFHPGNAVSPEFDSIIFKAVRKTLDFRLAHGGAGTGWSRAWLINCSARLLDGEMAHQHIRLLLEKSIARNLFDMHPPFQIDGNFGFTAGVCEMLVQSYEKGIIRLLPALPELWNTGKVSGLKAKNGIELEMRWENGSLKEAILYPRYDRPLKVIYPSGSKKIKLKAGVPYILKV